MNLFQKAKLLWSVASAFKKIKGENMKSGWKTSEFWLVLLSQAVPVIMMLWGLIPAGVMVQMMIVAGSLSAVFAGFRTFVKSTTSKTDDELFNKIVTSKVMVALKPIFDKLGVDISCVPLE